MHRVTSSEAELWTSLTCHKKLGACRQGSVCNRGSQLFGHQGPVSWKTNFPLTETGEGDGLGMIQAQGWAPLRIQSCCWSDRMQHSEGNVSIGKAVPRYEACPPCSPPGVLPALWPRGWETLVYTTPGISRNRLQVKGHHFRSNTDHWL